MALNIVWVAFFVVAFIFASYKLVVEGDTTIFKKLVDGIFDTSKTAITDVAFPLAGSMIFFLGLLNIAEKAGIVRFLSRLVGPFLRRLFPGVPKDHPAMGQMIMNFSANLLGLDNAATPFGLKAMQSLQSLNPSKETASNAQIMFLVLHTSGLTLIPLSIIAYRVSANSTDASIIFIPCVLATFIATLASVIIVSLIQRIRFDKVLLGGIAAIIAFVIGVLILVSNMDTAQKQIFSNIAGNLALYVIILGFIGAGIYKKVNLFDAFVEGGKEGFVVIVKIMPYLVGILVGIRVFRDSGAFDYLIQGITWCIQQTGVNTDFVPALPVAIMKPFSGSGARGLMLETMQKSGADSFVGRLSSIFQGSSDTTFYILALYFGSVGIKKVRYAIWAGLLADFLGVISAIIIAYIFFH